MATSTEPTVDIAGGITSTASVSVGAPELAGIDNTSDADWFKLIVPSDSTYTVSIQGRDGGGGTMADPDLVVRDSAGVYLSQDVFNSGHDAHAVLMPGAYWLDVRSYSGDTGTYKVVVTPSVSNDANSGQDIPNNPTSSAHLTTTGGVNGTLSSPSDVDWYQLDVAANQRIDVKATGGTLNDPDIVLRDFDGNYVAQSVGNSGQPAQLSVDHAGTYWVEVRSYGNSIDAQGSYALSATAGVTDVPGDMSTTTSISQGTQVNGDLTAGDSDWIKLIVPAGTSYTVGVNTNASAYTLADPDLVVRNYFGGYDSQSVGPGNPQVTLGSGTYFLDVRSYSGATGTYSVTIDSSFSPTASAQSDDGYTSAPASETGQIVHEGALS